MIENSCGFKAKCCRIPDDRDIVEVVRCKDCKKRYTVHCIQEEAGNINNQDDWYCADGERMEDDA